MASNVDLKVIQHHNQMVLDIGNRIFGDDLEKVKTLFEGAPLSAFEKSRINNMGDLFECFITHEFVHYGRYEKFVSRMKHHFQLVCTIVQTCAEEIQKLQSNLDDRGTFESPSSTQVPDPFEDISVRHATKHGNVRLLRALKLSNEDMTDSGQFFPLHTATSLGMKRITSFLLQSGFDLDERNKYGYTPMQCVDQQHSKVLYEYIQKVGGTEVPFSTDRHRRYFAGSKEPSVNMERVDLSTRTVYIPSAQFRSSFTDRDHSRKLMFVSPVLSDYATACTYQMYGLLWLLGRYQTEDYCRCLNDIFLPEKTLMQYKDDISGVIKYSTWIRSKEKDHIDRSQEINQLPKWIIELLQTKPELPRDACILNDGWTPMHYAVLTRNDELVRKLLDMGEGHLTDKTNTLLPKFILDLLQNFSHFEYEFVYSHIEGFTPLMLATFTGNQTAITMICQRIETLNAFNGKDIADCLTLAYCEDTELSILGALCRIGKEHLLENHRIDVILQPVYRKENPMRRILFGSSADVREKIEEDFFAVQLIVENKAAITKYLNPGSTGTLFKGEDSLLADTIHFHSDRLWKRHSHLNAIMPGHVSSLPGGCQGYDKNIMVVLHSNDRELIPSSELPFQEYLATNRARVLVHVVQGSFRFGPATTLQVGRGIAYEGLEGTLGMFVENSKKQVGILTCGHTFLRKFFEGNDAFCDDTFDPNTSADMLYTYKSEEKRLHVFKERRTPADEHDRTRPTGGNAMDSKPSMQRIGFVKRLLLRPDKKVAIDAALILFHDADTITRGPYLHVEHAEFQRQLQNLGVDVDYLQFSNGEELECKTPARVIKCGIGTGLTSGFIQYVYAKGQVRTSDGTTKSMGLGSSNRKLIMKGQIVVTDFRSVPSTSFFAQGDSGCAVFLKEKNSPLKGIGMGIGNLTNGSETLVTPIRSLLEAVSEGEDVKYSLLAFPDMPDAQAGAS